MVAILVIHIFGQIQLNTDAKMVKTAHCKCKVGMLRCHHMVAALLYAGGNISKTNEKQEWMKNPKTARSSLQQIKTVDELLSENRRSHNE